MPEGTHYRAPGSMTTKILNPLMVGAMRAGISVRGSRILEVRGRKSGTPRRTPVNLLEFEGHEYLVSPRGEGQWVRNVRADQGRLVLILGRKRDERTASELSDADKAPILRAYLRKWKAEVGAFFDGVTPDSTDEEMQRIASSHPVFLLSDPTG
jgi:deazaflavin-dependent oxidoreductase (nitroreductase family)